MDAIPPTLPFRLAKAYGVPKAAPITVTPVGPASVQGVRAPDAATPTDRAELGSSGKASAIRERLVAATVPGGVAFDDGVGVPTAPSVPAAASLPLYRHPADKNAAATGVTLGSRLDTQA